MIGQHKNHPDEQMTPDQTQEQAPPDRPWDQAPPERSREYVDPDHAVGVATVPDTAESDTAASDTAASDTAASDTAADPTVDARPGELPLREDAPEETGQPFLDQETVQRLRDQWQQVQLRFVDDPQAAVTEASALVDQGTAAVHEAVDRRRASLENWQSDHPVDTGSADTEQLRVAVRLYRDFLNRLLEQ